MRTIRLNGEEHRLDAPDDMPLLWAIRDILGFTGTKFGCGMGLCGACTMHMDGQPIRSCVTPISAAEGREITTIEAISKDSFLNLHSLEEDIIEEVRERMDSGKLKANFRDVYYVSTAKEKSWKQTHRIEERKKETTFTRNVVTQEDYEKVLAKARRRMRGSMS